jgi:hypothetical protein
VSKAGAPPASPSSWPCSGSASRCRSRSRRYPRWCSSPALGLGNIQQTTAPFSSPIIYLFLGGFLIAIAMQRWNLHRRLAISLIAVMGSRPTPDRRRLSARLCGGQHVGQQHRDRVDDAADRSLGCPGPAGPHAEAALVQCRPPPRGGLWRHHRRHGHADRHAAQCVARGVCEQGVRHHDRLRPVDADWRTDCARDATGRLARAHPGVVPPRSRGDPGHDSAHPG